MVLPLFSGRRASSMAAQTAAPGGYAHQNALPAAQLPAQLKCRFVFHPDDLVIHAGVQSLGHKARADTLNLMGTGRAAAEHRRGGGFHGHNTDGRVLLLEIGAGAAYGAAGARRRPQIDQFGRRCRPRSQGPSWQNGRRDWRGFQTARQ